MQGRESIYAAPIMYVVMLYTSFYHISLEKLHQYEELGFEWMRSVEFF